MPFPAIRTRLIHLPYRGSMDAVCSGPKQVALRFSPEGDPALVWVRPAGRLPVTVFTGAQTERPSNHINNHPEAKSKGLQKFS